VTVDHAQIDLLLDLISARYGRTLTDDERTLVRADVIATRERVASLNTIALANGDEPMPLFSVDALGSGQ
jgi:hypothetical protein